MRDEQTEKRNRRMQRRPWRKNLYDNVGYDDNYTDSSFLQDMRTNLHVRLYTYGEAVIGASVLNNQISCVTGFHIVFYLMYIGKATPLTVLLPSCLTAIIGYMVYRCVQREGQRFVADDSKTLLTMIIFGYIFSPLLHSLTDSISTDTIFAVTFIVMLVNVIFYDYGLSVAMVSKTMSLNAALFGSICLASRLANSLDAFALLVTSAVFFVLYPMLTAICWRCYYLIPICIICAGCLYYISGTVCLLYVLLTVFVNFVCPWIFVSQQKYKNNIHGPWDEAIVEEHTDDVIAAYL